MCPGLIQVLSSTALCSCCPWPASVGIIVLPVLGAVPDGSIVLFSGMGPDAQQQVPVCVGALAVSIIMLRSIFAGRVNLDENERLQRARGSHGAPPDGQQYSLAIPPAEGDDDEEEVEIPEDLARRAAEEDQHPYIGT
ncbi:hypothetical protein PF005_g23868 [Phytophthora fragariae]|uniref:Uncharacterized protein n=1 Tax=Phytophthora fragariae TaxID=53985 RepID=A0A6A3RLC6_9STRA|nr:hypothetical protein PF009_g11126 [Phytophthora fragariae]KAE8979944.1 hypothetical protein PF011_g22644 [Phytophthora fragariae]KAE9077826.1 hypothetical protein PF010_g23364 [Phytophthora fragariae]KAE9099086.1 hypothetical protein PF006_g23223 [Phytophthora fragariae]KAE9178964.1 hypothetical protein PF005_g23868 [Phytophthora fragariae]